MVFFTFPEDARWNDEQAAVEFTVLLGEYEGTVRVHRRVFQRLLDQSPTPERCLEAVSPPANPVRAGGRAEAETATVDR